ncbi:MAG: 2-oxo acid dehydrogenase subunit E2, partial [Planctomycetaceae bacterium]
CAVDTPDGLLVPVVRDCDQKSISEIAAALSEVAARARDGNVKLSEMQGACFTITNLGGIGGTAFTPIVNYPEVAILGLSRGRTELKLIEGKVEERLMLPLSLSYDHRVINGAAAARFVVRLGQLLNDYFHLTIQG